MLIKESLRLKHKAQGFYQEHLQNMLESFGEVQFVGSFELDVMVWPDIDIQIIFTQGTPIDNIGEISKRLLADPHLRHVKLLNFYNKKPTPFAPGICLCAEFMHVDGLAWKVDIWSQDEPERENVINDTQYLKSKLNDENRALVLKWKNKLLNDHARIPKQGSVSVYKAILEKGLKDDEEIVHFLSKKGFLNT